MVTCRIQKNTRIIIAERAMKPQETAVIQPRPWCRCTFANYSRGSHLRHDATLERGMQYMHMSRDGSDGGIVVLVRRKLVHYTTQVSLKLTRNDSVRLAAVN